METTLERVRKRLSKIKKKPVRAKVKRVIKVTKPKRVAPRKSVDKYATMLAKLEDHFGASTIPDLLDFIASEKSRQENLSYTPKTKTGKYRLVKQSI